MTEEEKAEALRRVRALRQAAWDLRAANKAMMHGILEGRQAAANLSPQERAQVLRGEGPVWASIVSNRARMKELQDQALPLLRQLQEVVHAELTASGDLDLPEL